MKEGKQGRGGPGPHFRASLPTHPLQPVFLPQGAYSPTRRDRQKSRSGQVHPRQRKLPHPPHLLPGGGARTSRGGSSQEGAGQPAPPLASASELASLGFQDWLPCCQWAGGPSATGLPRGPLQEWPTKWPSREGGPQGRRPPSPSRLQDTDAGAPFTRSGLGGDPSGGQPPGQPGRAQGRACRIQGRGARSVGKRERGDCDSIEANMLQSTSSP